MVPFIRKYSPPPKSVSLILCHTLQECRTMGYECTTLQLKGKGVRGTYTPSQGMHRLMYVNGTGGWA